tara:strand:- start:729 stop:1439 length:711 start_codon:yes stop_codon:yes gene_type:complete
MIVKKITGIVISLFIVYSLPASEISKQAQLLFKEALEFNASGDYASAVSKYIEAFNEDGDIAGLSDEGLLENALSYFKKILKDSPQDLEILMWLGTIETLRGDVQSAIKYYQKVVNIAPTSPQGLDADKEILRMESEVRNRQESKIKKKEQELRKMNQTQILRDNIRREMDQKYSKQIEALHGEISELKEQTDKLKEEAQKARELNEKMRKEHEELKEKNAHHRRMYLFYKYRKGK